MKKFEAMRLLLQAAFPLLNDYLQTEQKATIYILDYEKTKTSYLANSTCELENTYIINMENGQEVQFNNLKEGYIFKIIGAPIIGFLPIDGKSGLLGMGESHCDCVFFDDKYFCFVEFKLNADSTANSRAVRKNRKKAAKQLGNTISIFDEKLGSNYGGLTLEAYIATPPTYPRNDAAWKQLAVTFLEKYGVQLFEACQKNYLV